MTTKKNVSIELHLDGLERMAGSACQRRALSSISMRAASAMEKYVPMRSGALRQSQHLSSRYAEGDIVYNTPYAERQYWLHSSHRTTPGTDGEWDVTAFRAHGKDLAQYAAAALLEGNA